LADLTARSVAKRILGAYYFRRYLRLGYLKYEVSRNGKRRFFNKVIVEAIASFMATVVTRATAARLLGIQMNSAGYWFKKCGLKQVTHRYSRAFKYPLYLRTEVMNFKAISVRVKNYSRLQTKEILQT